MCCEPIGWNPTEEEKKRIKPCPDCGVDTIDGEPFDGCAYSPVECETCGWKPCDGSC